MNIVFVRMFQLLKKRMFYIMKVKRMGTSVLKTIKKAVNDNQQLELIYMSDSGQITKRRIKVLMFNDDLFSAYCFLRGANRTFKGQNVLALVPIVRKESMVV